MVNALPFQATKKALLATLVFAVFHQFESAFVETLFEKLLDIEDRRADQIKNFFIRLPFVIALWNFCFETLPKRIAKRFIGNRFENTIDHIGRMGIAVNIHKRYVAVYGFGIMAQDSSLF